MYKKHSITSSALTCPSLFIENTDKNQCPSYHSVHLTSPPRWLPSYANRTTSLIKYLRAKTGHPSKYLPVTTHAMEKMMLNRQSKISIMRTPPKHFLISFRTQPTAKCHRHLLSSSLATILPTFFRNHCLTKIVISVKESGFAQFLRFYLYHGLESYFTTLAL